MLYMNVYGGGMTALQKYGYYYMRLLFLQPQGRRCIRNKKVYYLWEKVLFTKKGGKGIKFNSSLSLYEY